MPIIKLLSTSAHTTLETAHVIKDWPYGRTLRCEKRVWIETRPKFGQRVVSCTTNPKAGNKFNKPHAGGYSDLCLFGEDDQGMLTFDGLNMYSEPKKFEEIRRLGLDEQQQARVSTLERVSRRYNSRSWAEYDSNQGKFCEKCRGFHNPEETCAVLG
jgi:hypothetical protein